MSNLMSIRKKERINTLNSETKKKLELLWSSKVEDYQFVPGKITKVYPEKGDVFLAKLPIGIEVYGIVLNNHILSKNGDDLIVIALYIKSPLNTKDSFDFEDMLIQPTIVDDNYWKKGLFVKIEHNVKINFKIDYGFYRIFADSFCDEYGNQLESQPAYLETYGISTIHGVAFKTMEELIFRGIL